jgi:hypothetical protein
MKKILLTSVFALLVMVTFGSTFDLGLKGGINTSSFPSSSSSFSAESRGGYNFGAFGRFGGKRLYFQPEFLFVSNKGDITVDNVKDAVTMKSIQVPALLGLNLLNLKVTSLHLFTGPAISFSSGYDSSQNLTYNINNSSWDYQLGGGVDILIFTLDLRYSWGLSDKVTNTSFTSKVNTFCVSLGIKLL